jgi:hypothetical protein
MIIKEVWLPLHGIKDANILSEKYRVSNYGKIFNIIDCKFVKLSLYGKPKYHYVTLTHKNARGTYRVHRLAALSFIENPDDLPIVDHEDRNRLNNYVGNLRWVTRSQNQKNSDRSDSIGNNSNYKQSRVKYKGITKVGDTYHVRFQGKYYGSCSNEKKAAQIFDVIASHNLKEPYLNFPHEKLCDYNNIYKFLTKQSGRHICNDLKDRIIYKWKHEHITQITLAKKYKIDPNKISKLLKGISAKQKKPVWKISKEDVRRLYYKRKIMEDYLNGEYSRKKLAEKYSINAGSIDIWLKDLPCLGRRASLPEKIQKEIYNLLICGIRPCKIQKDYGVSYSMIRDIKNKYKKIRYNM